MFYYAVKTFETFNEAVEEVMKSSYSLAQSDLGLIKAKDFSEVQASIDRYYDEEFQSSFAQPSIWFGKSHYSENVTENFNVAEESEEEMQEGFDNFYYSTSSGINDVMIRELKSEGKIVGYETVYSVMSDKPLEYSTAMSEFRKNGWQCSERAYELSIEEELSLREEYESKLIEDIHRSQELPDIYFSVSYSSSSDGSIPYISSHCIGNNPNTVETLLKNHPELGDEILEIIDGQVAEMDAIEIPTTYDFNEVIYRDSDFYSVRRDEVRKTLISIRDAILTRKSRGGIASKEEELSGLKEEEKMISETEKLIKSIERDNNKSQQKE